MNKVCIVGSINMDMVMNVNSLPKMGETVLSKDLKKVPGGKGANQAVAASRLGAKVCMIGAIGRDQYGEELFNSLIQDGINVEYIVRKEEVPTGLAMITVDDNGDNTIVVVSGANMDIDETYIETCTDVIEKNDIIITQLETPVDVGIKAFKLGKQNNKITILNPAPAKEIPDQFLKYTDIIIPNETEAYELTKIEVHDLESAKKAAKVFLNRGVKFVIITLGSKGAALISENKAEIIPAYKVDAIDSTAAGDSFIGALSSKISELNNLSFDVIKDAVEFGNRVSSITVTRKGAQSSIPYLKDIK